MGSSYLPPSEQNVVNVGDELSQAAIDAINAAVSPSGTNPFVTASEAAGAGFSDYDNFKVYAAGDVVLASNDFYRFNTFIGAAGYGPITHPAAWTKLSAADLTGYAQLNGSTFTGKVNTPAPTSTFCGLNIGSFLSSSVITGSVAGDIWIGTFQLTYKNGQGSVIYGAATNIANNFGAPQIIDTSNAAAALRVTQRGSGNAIEIEDSPNPDSNRFVVSNNGKVGIGVTPDATAALKVDTNGIMFGDGTIQTTATVQGIQGIQGPPGNNGSDGAQGPAGSNGNDGAQGPPGAGVINWRGGWDYGTFYQVNDAVSYDGSSYIAVVNQSGNQPYNGSGYWGLLALKGANGIDGTNGGSSPYTNAVWYNGQWAGASVTTIYDSSSSYYYNVLTF